MDNKYTQTQRVYPTPGQKATLAKTKSTTFTIFIENLLFHMYFLENVRLSRNVGVAKSIWNPQK